MSSVYIQSQFSGNAHKNLPCNYQLSKSIVHEIKFGDNKNNLPYSDRYFNTDWQFEMFKRGKPLDMILV